MRIRWTLDFDLIELSERFHVIWCSKGFLKRTILTLKWLQWEGWWAKRTSVGKADDGENKILKWLRWKRSKCRLSAPLI